jgi:phenylacetate-CoA ligase
MEAIARRRSTLKLSREARERRNLERFRKLVSFVQQSSPWYRQVIETQRIDARTCRPEDFPVLTTTMVRENFDDIVTDRSITRDGLKAFVERFPSPKDLFLGRYHVVLSSGSTGLPAYYLHTTDELVNGMSYGFFHRRLKPRTRTSFIGILGEHKMSTAVMSLMDRWPESLLFNACNFDVRAPWEKTIAGINEHRPQVISAYKHVLMRLAEDARARRLMIKPVLLESGGEPLFRHERAFLRSTFKCEVANSYGSSEVNLMGVALNDWGGIFLFEDDLMFELDEDFTCVTNLYNRALPLIRYRFDDILSPLEVDKLHLPFRVVSETISRSQELISFSTGDGSEKKFKIIVFENVDFSGVRRVEFVKRDAATLAVGVELIGSAGQENGVRNSDQEIRLERLKHAMRQHLDAHELQGIQLEIYSVRSRNDFADDGRKDKLVMKTSR